MRGSNGASMAKDVKRNLQLTVFFAVAISLVFMFVTYGGGKPDRVASTSRQIQQLLQSRRVWISISVCWSGNTAYHGKEHYPYTAAARLSAKLWHSVAKLPTIVQVIHSEADANSTRLLAYLDELRANGSMAEAVTTGDDGMECALKSQLQRMFAFRLPYVRPTDLVVTADADTFVAAVDSMEDLYRPGYKVWVYQYGYTVAKGETFAMDYIGMEAELWKSLLACNSPEELVAKFTEPLLLDTYDTTWGYDQLIVSRIILENRLCSLPSLNKVWESVKLEAPQAEFDDREVCFHGVNKWRDCNVNVRHKKGGCRKWHFLPSQTEADMVAKYNEIINASAG